MADGVSRKVGVLGRGWFDGPDELAAGDDGGGERVGVGSHENDPGFCPWFFQRFEQGVLGFYGQGLGLEDEGGFLFLDARFGGEEVFDCPDVVNAGGGVGGDDQGVEGVGLKIAKWRVLEALEAGGRVVGGGDKND